MWIWRYLLSSCNSFYIFCLTWQLSLFFIWWISNKYPLGKLKKKNLRKAMFNLIGCIVKIWKSIQMLFTDVTLSNQFKLVLSKEWWRQQYKFLLLLLLQSRFRYVPKSCYFHLQTAVSSYTTEVIINMAGSWKEKWNREHMEKEVSWIALSVLN